MRTHDEQLLDKDIPDAGTVLRKFRAQREKCHLVAAHAVSIIFLTDDDRCMHCAGHSENQAGSGLV